jgi:adenylate cyclase
MKSITSNRLITVLIATIVYTTVGLLLARVLNVPMKYALTGAPLVGLLISSFEVFYFQARRGSWLRKMHPLKSNCIYTLVVVAIFVVVQHVNFFAHGRGWHELPVVYAKYPVFIPAVILLSLLIVMFLRVISFIGGKNILYLLVGKYHRPVWERKIFMFLDIIGSTEIVDSLGPEKSNLLFGKFMFDAAKPVAENRGEIYRYQGDGFVATWNWDTEMHPAGVFKAVDDLYAAVEEERAQYEKSFGCCPDFRVGIHGGEIITCEEGDLRRNIAFYGETINIAARMEAKAKSVGMDCVITSDIAMLHDDPAGRLINIGEESVRGINKSITLYGFNRRLTPKTV